jgi:hypothetical protein
VPCKKFGVINRMWYVVSVHPAFQNQIVDFQINIHNKRNQQHSYYVLIFWMFYPSEQLERSRIRENNWKTTKQYYIERFAGRVFKR